MTTSHVTCKSGSRLYVWSSLCVRVASAIVRLGVKNAIQTDAGRVFSVSDDVTGDEQFYKVDRKVENTYSKCCHIR